MSNQKIIFICEVIVVFALTIIAVAGDLKEYKIKNQLVLITFIAGVILVFIRLISGYDVLDYVSGIIIAFVITFALFLIKGIGAGDAKFLSAIGLIVGYHLIVRVIGISVVIGAIIGVISIFIRHIRNKKQSVVNIGADILSSNGIGVHVFHFSPAIFIAELVTFAMI